MATKLKANKADDEKFIKAAQKRVQLPENWQSMKYLPETDLLYVTISENLTVRSKGDVENGIYLHYDSRGNLTTIEITDLFGKFATT